jgi:hypothetical protein
MKQPKYNEMQYDFQDQIRVNVFLDSEKILQAKVQALKENVSLSKLVDKAIAQHLKSK